MEVDRPGSTPDKQESQVPRSLEQRMISQRRSDRNAAELERLRKKTKDNPANLPRDIIWAYENRTNRQTTPKDAPSCGAWEMLQFARENRNDFIKTLLPKAFAAREKAEEASKVKSSQDLTLVEVERLLKEVSGGGQ